LFRQRVDTLPVKVCRRFGEQLGVLSAKVAELFLRRAVRRHHAGVEQ
jgi:hypothetical protein